MISLEQVKLLETKVTKAIDRVKKATEENARLKEKLDSYQSRIGELEILIERFKEEQSRIEDGILSALDRLNQFEDAVENALSNEGKLSDESGLSNEGALSEADAPRAGNSGAEDKLPADKAASPSAGPEEKKAPLPETPRGEGGELDIF